MKHLIAAASVALALTAGTMAEARTYSGPEANALRCANTLSFTAVAMFEAGMISANDRDAMILYSVMILDRYVSGSQEQKMAGLEAMANHYGFEGTLEDFADNADNCIRMFPV